MDLAINNLAKVYNRKVCGLADFSLNVNPGVLGLVGPNGAGKSTLMRILATVTLPTSGRVTWDGHDIVKSPNVVRRILGYLPQDFGIYPNLSASEFLTYMAAARGIVGRAANTRIHQLLELVNMVDARKRRLGSLSGGMKQRIGIAQALLNDPRLLIVDEPTAGLDPEERIRFRNLLPELPGDRIVILSSHIVSDIEAAASSIAIMNKGRLVICGTPEELLASADGKVWEVLIPGSRLAELKRASRVSSTTRTGADVRARVVGDKPVGTEVKSTTPILEDAYLLQLARDNSAQKNE